MLLPITATARQWGIRLCLAAGLVALAACAAQKPAAVQTVEARATLNALIFFPLGRASLVPSADPVLDKVLGGLASCPSCQVTLVAFACKGESTTGPNRLAAQRAVAVSDHLSAHAIGKDRIILAVAGADYGPAALQTIGGDAPMCRTFVDARVAPPAAP